MEIGLVVDCQHVADIVRERSHNGFVVWVNRRRG
jgi:hypothetical protein